LYFSHLHSPSTHRDHLSFPTRRSPDLTNAVQSSHSYPWGEPSMKESTSLVAERADPMPASLHSSRRPGGASPGQPRHGPALAVADRKSTRLNSSHGSISYAVFCCKNTI